MSRQGTKTLRLAAKNGEIVIPSDQEIDAAFGLFLAHHRWERGWTYFELAQKTGIGSNRIYMLEAGRAAKGVTRNECQRLSKAFGVDQSVIEARASGHVWKTPDPQAPDKGA